MPQGRFDTQALFPQSFARSVDTVWTLSSAAGANPLQRNRQYAVAIGLLWFHR
jgi:hypothetical protein